MKRKDIRGGVVYAEVSAYGGPSPVVFLEDEAATVWLEPYNNIRRGGPYIACRPSEKPHREKGWSGRSQGYATVQGPAEVLEGLDAAAELEAFKAGGKPSREGLRFVLLFSLAKIASPYSEAVVAHEQAQAQEREDSRRRIAEHDAAIHRLDAVTKAFGDFGIRAGSGGSDRVSISIEDAERLIALLREKTGN